MPTPEPLSYLLYDGECPACRSYVAFSRLRKLYPHIAVIDAREALGLVSDLRARGYEVNDGMMLRLDGAYHYGPAATRMIAELAGPSGGMLTRGTLYTIGAAPWSGGLYPWLNRSRQLLLRLLGRGLIP